MDTIKAKTIANLIAFFISSLVFIHLISLTVMLIPFNFVEIHLSLWNDLLLTWTNSIYFIANTMTTCGYGDITALGVWEQSVMIIVELLGIILYSYSYKKSIQAIEASIPYPGLILREKDRVYWWIFQRESMSGEHSDERTLYRLKKYLIFQMNFNPVFIFNNETFEEIPIYLQKNLILQFRDFMVNNFLFFKIFSKDGGFDVDGLIQHLESRM